MTDPGPAKYSPLQQGVPLPEDDAVYRRISSDRPDMLTKDAITGERFPNKGAFKLDPDGISVFSEYARRTLRLELGHLMTAEQNILLRLIVADIRQIDSLEVVGDPWPENISDADHPRNGAHALIRGLEEGRENRRGLRDRLLKLRFELLNPRLQQWVETPEPRSATE